MATAMWSAPAMAEYPERAVTIVVPYAPGGQFDLHGRLIADELSKKLGQPFVVENKPGAATMIGAQYVSKAEPDGYTLLMGGATMFTILPHEYNSLPYKVEDLVGITMLQELPVAIVLNPKAVPARTLPEFIDYAKANPGIKFATTGRGNSGHLMLELLAKEVGISLEAVHYSGSGPARQDLLAGNVALIMEGPSTSVANIQDGLIVGLGIAGAERVSALPDVPTFSELGYPQLNVPSWSAMVAPAGTPDDVIDKLNSALNEILNDSAVRERLVRDVTSPIPGTREEFAARVSRDSEIWKGVIEQLGIKLD